ncbi:hypothetical protein BC829DRAFT_404882 [Chytridium lagenaria]|nr:hypothetical protein BC829DRAFT_404882 [Chytridium lagenaria]
MADSDTLRLRKAQGAAVTASLADKIAEKAKGRPLPLKRPVFAKGLYLKLAFFSILMFTLPIASFFYTQEYIFKGNSTYSAIVAAIVANIVLIAYIIVAFLEDDEDDEKLKKKT